MKYYVILWCMLFVECNLFCFVLGGFNLSEIVIFNVYLLVVYKII